MNEATNLRNKNLIKSVFIRILLPALAAGASANIASMIDGVIVGNAIGRDALAAVNACRPATQIFGFLSEIFASGLANCIAHSVGKNEKDNTNRIFTTGLMTALIVGLLLTAVQFAFSGGICRLFANNDTLYPMTLEYFRIFSFSVLFILLNDSLAASMRTDGKQSLSALVALLPHIVNAVLNVVFVSVFGMGLQGVALATVLGYIAGFAVGCYYYFFKKSYRISFGNYTKNLAGITSVGFPPAINKGLISIKLLIINSLALASGGSLAMAIMSLIMVEWALESLFIGGVKQTMLPMISFYYASGDYHGVRSVFMHAFKVLMIAEAVLILLFEAVPQILPLLFGMREADEIAAASTAIRIFALSMPMEAFTMLTITYYTAIRNRKTAVFLSVLQGLVATVPVIYPLVHCFGVTGVWLSYPAAGLIPLAAIAILSRCNTERFFKMSGHTYLQEFSVIYEKIPETVESVIRAVRDAGFDKNIANRTGMAIEEMAVSAFKRNQGRKLHVDVTVRKTEEMLLVTFADDGVQFDPLQYAETDKEDQPSNIAVLKSISHKVEYGRVVGMNKTDITLK